MAKGKSFYQIAVGMKFTRLLVIGIVPQHIKKSHWICRCDCGAVKEILAASLKSGNSTSCGCLRLERVRQRTGTHGATKTGEYSVWRNMLQRCGNPNNTHYQYYGGRGVKVCARWDSFPQFLSDMGLRPTNLHTIDRINTYGNYEPGNCRWITRREQSLNLRNNRRITVNGETLVISEWARRLKAHPSTICHRIDKMGWDGARAVTTPTGRGGRDANL